MLLKKKRRKKMKKTNEELLKFFGLKVGDKIKVDGYYYPFVIVEENGKIFAKRENSLSSWDYYDIGKLTNVLLNREYEIIKPKKIGELICDGMLCRKCPLRAIECDAKGKTLYEALENYKKYLNSFNGSLKPFEKALIGAIKVELDKDVEVE